jgi:hypothetical protein
MKKMEIKLISLIVFLFALVILLSNNIYAIGITPGRVTLEFEPGAEKIVSFSIVNTEHKAMNLSINVEGEWASYTTLSQNHIEFSPSDEIKTLSYRFRMPSKTDSSGIKTRVIAFESKSGNGTINTIVAVEQQLYIYSAGIEEQQPQEKEQRAQQSVQEANETINETKQNESAERGKILFIFENTQTNKIAVIVAAALIIALIILVLVYLIRRFRKHARQRKNK